MSSKRNKSKASRNGGDEEDTTTYSSASMMDAIDSLDGDSGSSAMKTSSSSQTRRATPEEVKQQQEHIFPEVTRYANSKDEGHRRLLAVLQAVTEVLLDNNVNPLSPTAYFGALFRALDNHQSSAEPELTAILHLLHIVMSKLPQNVLKAKYSPVSTRLLQIVEARLSQGSILRQTVESVEHLLMAQDLSLSWSQQANMHALFQWLLTFSIDARPKLRKAAQSAVLNIVKTNVDTIDRSAFTLIYKFSEQAQKQAKPTTNKLSKKQRKRGRDQEEEEDNDSNVASEQMHLLALFRSLLPLLPEKNQISICEGILLPVLIATGETFVVLTCLQSIEAMFTDSNTKITPSAASAIVSKLFGSVPFNPSDSQRGVAHARLITKALIKLHELDSSASAEFLPQLFTGLMQMLRGDADSTLCQEATSLMTQAIKELIDDELIDDSVAKSYGTETTPLHQVIQLFEAGLGFAYKQNWVEILQLCSHLFRRCGKRADPLLKRLLQLMGELREAKDIALNSSIDAAIGTALASMGPANFLQILPLNIEPGAPPPNRYWMLPLFKHHLSHAPLSYFAKSFLPLAQRFATRAKELIDTGKETNGVLAEIKNCKVLYDQIWALFPQFCIYPPDLSTSFKLIAKNLGTSLQNEPDLRLSICNGLCNLIEKNKAIIENSQAMNDEEAPAKEMLPGRKAVTPEQAKENISAIAAFSKNFLPCLFNIFATSSAVDRPLLQQTIAAYISITESQLVNTFFKTVVKKLIEATSVSGPDNQMNDPVGAQTMTDMSLSFVKYIDIENINLLFKAIKPHLQRLDDHTLEKKSFKVLLHICKNHPQFVKKNISELRELLLDKASFSASSKKVRLNALGYIIEALPAQQFQIMSEFLVDVVISTKETNSKTRSAAFDILIRVANKLKLKDEKKPSKGSFREGTNTSKLQELFTMIIAGLAGTTPHMMGASILALSRLLFEFHDQLDRQYLSDMLETMELLLQTRAREVIRAILGFLKVAISCFAKDLIEQHLKSIITGLLSWSGETKEHFRLKVKVLLERLIRKFSYEKIQRLVPGEHQKLIANIKKQKERAQKKKDQQKTDGKKEEKKKTFDDILADSDDEDDDNDNVNTAGKAEESKTKKDKKSQKTKGKGKEGQKVWIKNDAGDDDMEAEPIDFLDPRSVQSVVSSQPKKRKRDDSSFKEDESGRLVIENIDKKKGDKKRSKDSDEMNVDGDEGDGEKSTGKTKTKPGATPAGPKQQQKGGGKGEKRAKLDVKHTGKEYAAKKAKGDIKKEGKPDPFAYIPLNPKLLNKRFKTKASQHWKSHSKK